MSTNKPKLSINKVSGSRLPMLVAFGDTPKEAIKKVETLKNPANPGNEINGFCINS